MTDDPDNSQLLAKLATGLSAVRGGPGALEPVDLAGRARLLRIARNIAHATERQNAPLSAYLIGRFVQDAIRAGISEADAIEEATLVVRSLIGDGAG